MSVEPSDTENPAVQDSHPEEKPEENAAPPSDGNNIGQDGLDVETKPAQQTSRKPYILIGAIIAIVVVLVVVAVVLAVVLTSKSSKDNDTENRSLPEANRFFGSASEGAFPL